MQEIIHLLIITIIVKDTVLVPAFSGSLVYLLTIVLRKISIRNCKALNIKCLEVFMLEYQFSKRLKILGNPHALKYTFCIKEPLLEWMQLYFQLGKQCSVDLHRYLESTLLFPIIGLCFSHSSEGNIFPMPMSQQELIGKFKNIGSKKRKEKEEKEE